MECYGITTAAEFPGGGMLCNIFAVVVPKVKCLLSEGGYVFEHILE